MQGCDWTSPWCTEDNANIKDGRNQMAQQGPSAWRTWTNTGNTHRNASSEETNRSCTMWVATSITMHVAQRGANRQREVIVPTPATKKLTEARVDVGTWGHPGLPHIRLDCTVVDEGAHHYSSAIRKGQEEALAAAQAERAKTNKYGKAKGGVGVTGISMQLNGRFGPWLDTLLRVLARYNKAAYRDGGRPLQEWQKLLSVALARYTASTVPSATGHTAWRGTMCALVLFPLLVPFDTEPLVS